MAPKLTDEQRLAIEQQPGLAVKVVDPATDSTFYLISDDQFSRIRCLLEAEPFEIRETYAAQDRALGTVWNTDELDIYNDSDSAP